MKTISMIGLINNVYNEFHIPERIKINYGWYEETFKWDKNEKWFVTLDDSTLLRIDQNKLNMEVEIIEETNKFTKEDFIKERMKLDGITIKQFNERYEVKECNCGMPYCRGFIAKEKKVEDKKIEKLNKILRINDLKPPYDENLEMIWKNIIIQQNKINEIINKMEEIK